MQKRKRKRHNSLWPRVIIVYEEVLLAIAYCDRVVLVVTAVGDVSRLMVASLARLGPNNVQDSAEGVTS